MPANTVIQFRVVDLRGQDSSRPNDPCPYLLYIYERQTNQYREWCAQQTWSWDENPLAIGPDYSGNSERTIDVVFSKRSSSSAVGAFWMDVVGRSFPKGQATANFTDLLWIIVHKHSVQ